MAFNDEQLVRRIAQSHVPIVSAVGHEVDTTLCDLVADARAATPSEAAELVVPDELARRRELNQLAQHLARAMLRRVRDDRTVLHRLRTKLSDPRFMIAQKQQQLDELALRVERRALGRLVPLRAQLNRLEQRVMARHPPAVLLKRRNHLGPLSARLEQVLRLELAHQREVLSRQQASLHALSPVAILGRGYSITLDAQGKALRSAARVRPGDRRPPARSPGSIPFRPPSGRSGGRS